MRSSIPCCNAVSKYRRMRTLRSACPGTTNSGAASVLSACSRSISRSARFLKAWDDQRTTFMCSLLCRLLLQLLLQLLDEAPVGALGDELLGAAFDHPHFVEPQGVEADGVFRVVLTLARIGNLPKGLRCIVQLVYIPTAHDEAGRPIWVRGTQGGSLEDGPQRPFACDGMLAYEIPMGADHAAEVLRPRAIRGCAEH